MAQAGSCSTVPLAGKFQLEVECSSHYLVDLVVYLHAKFGEFNLRINKIGPGVKTGQGDYLKCSNPGSLAPAESISDRLNIPERARGVACLLGIFKLSLPTGLSYLLSGCLGPIPKVSYPSYDGIKDYHGQP